MPRPEKIREAKKTYNLLMTQQQYNKLLIHAHEQQRYSREQVAVADLIREAIDIYIEALEETDAKDEVLQKQEG